MRTCLQFKKVNCIGEGICINGMLVKITGSMFVLSLFLFSFFAFFNATSNLTLLLILCITNNLPDFSGARKENVARK